VISYLVNERTQEIGIRLALGAERKNILHMILHQGLALAAIGAGIGLIAALIVARLMRSVLYGVGPTDPITFVAVPAIFIAVAVLACYLPARRATKVDPMIALRRE
jgi:ABC-type antimicrobial peptide transport system permease subunit